MFKFRKRKNQIITENQKPLSDKQHIILQLEAFNIQGKLVMEIMKNTDMENITNIRREMQKYYDMGVAIRQKYDNLACIAYNE